ncbi:MAG: hypothetical protein K2W96_07850, partial [Gemmataceae bacterium]|nr:hypothetical protein [Gemmataceae bacterium]
RQWMAYWGGSESGALQGRFVYAGGDLGARGRPDPARLTPDDFQLAAASPGQGKGGGKDLGADVNLVGPGAAYERWKTTPEGRAWRAEADAVFGKKPAPAAAP